MFTTEWGLAVNADLRSAFPDTPLASTPVQGANTVIWVDLSLSFAQRSETIGLLRFLLDGLVSVRKATLQLFTVSSTSGTVSAYRMKQAWDATATWNQFGFDGIQNDGVEAESVASFALVAPSGNSFVTTDVTADIQYWLDFPDQNWGWVFLTVRLFFLK